MDLVSKVTEDYLSAATAPDAARLRFLKGLWEIQSRIESVERAYDAPGADAAREALVAGQPIFRVSAPEVPLAEYVEAVGEIALYASRAAGLPADQAAALHDADFAAAIDGGRLARAVRAPQAFFAETADTMGAQPNGPLTTATVAFVLFSALVPFLTGPSRSALETLGEFDPHAWGSGRCPVCGADAAMGRMGESTALRGAERTLWCGLCHAEWGYERLRCVRCGTMDPNGLRYTHVEGDPAHRVHLCDECHGYTRFVFVDDLDKQAVMVVEDAVMTTLDAVAMQQGYTATGDGGKNRC
ncbi:MAG TPA: formate dehydrogenase accessory protein FdhE [Coriobacteriia bacterium]